jgi:hypothetical protein
MLKKESALTEDDNKVLAQEITNLIINFVETDYRKNFRHIKGRFFDQPLNLPLFSNSCSNNLFDNISYYYPCNLP